MVRRNFQWLETGFNSVNIGIKIPITYGATKARIKSFWITKSKQRSQCTTATENVGNANAKCFVAIPAGYEAVQLFSARSFLPNAKEIVSAAQLGYKTGDIGYVEYLLPCKPQPIFS